MTSVNVSGAAVHRPFVGLDVVRYSQRDGRGQTHARERVGRMAKRAAKRARIPWADCHKEDRGDGLLLVGSPTVSVEDLLGEFAARLYAEVCDHNAMANDAGQLRLRMAVDAGFVRFDPSGVDGPDVIRMFRLLDANSFKSVLDRHSAAFGLITSTYVYDQVVRNLRGSLVEPRLFEEIPIAVKETEGTAWMSLPAGERLFGAAPLWGAASVSAVPSDPSELTDG